MKKHRTIKDKRDKGKGDKITTSENRAEKKEKGRKEKRNKRV